MRLPFLNRVNELKRLKRAILNNSSSLLVIYGRRRIGKSVLLQRIIKSNDIYFLADQNEKVLQIQNLAREISRVFKGFDEVQYPDWESLFNNFNKNCYKGTVLALDEFPYLVYNSPELPSIIQNIIDKNKMNFHLIICGSSQRMMYGLVMDETAPLYGRALEILKLRPLSLGWIKDALNCNPVDCIAAYSIWGGVPHYWQLASQFSNLAESIKYLILDRDGLLHNEPWRLLTDDLRSTVQTNSILLLIANGCHKLSEISARIQKPPTSLTRPLSNLIDLGYIKKEIPYGENLKSTKRTLYKLNDPFLLFWYFYVLPNKSLLEADLIDDVYTQIQKSLNIHISEIWEEIARTSTSYLNIGNKKWKPGYRWWGKGKDGNTLEIDVAAESIDGKAILIGEAKWENKSDLERIQKKLVQQKNNLPFIKDKKVIYAYWLKNYTVKKDVKNVILPKNILDKMR